MQMDAGRTLLLVVLGMSIGILLLAAGRAHAVEDQISIGSDDGSEDLTFYVGEEPINLNIDFNNNWSSYNAILTSPLLLYGSFDFSNDRPVSAGDGWGANILLNKTASPGIYVATLTIDRTSVSGVRELKVLDYTIDYRQFVEFTGFGLVDTSSGLRIRVHVRTYWPCEEFHFWFIVWEDFDVVPEEFNIMDMQPGNRTFECDVRKSNLYSPAPTMAGYHGYARVGDSHIEWDLEDESPAIKSDAGWSSPGVISPIVLLVFAVIVIVAFLRQRRMRRTRPHGPDGANVGRPTEQRSH
jgi:hypothetical protein